MVTLKDIGKEANVSVMTVSNVINKISHQLRIETTVSGRVKII
ncbi:LacI family DNA-binding transcriptional regulator [Fervidibacillus halotolerans]